jgi:putative transposase
VFPGFSHWQDGYAAFTHCHKERDAVIEYIKKQEEHHRKTTFRDELRRLLVEAGVEFDEKYLL